MSTSLGPEDISLEPLPSHPARSKAGPRRRTVSTSFEQNRSVKNQNRSLDLMGRKTQSFAQDMAGLPQNLLKKQAIYNSFVEKQTEEDGNNEKKTWWQKIPCFGIILVFVAITIYQGGSVVAKKLNINPILMVLMRDVITASFNMPFLIQANQTPFPKGRRTIIVIRGMSVGILLMAHFYAVRHLPLADVMMISSIKPVSITLLSCIFLKEACGLLEILNLLLVISGIFLVVQPSMVFGSSDQEYSTHMLYTALGLMLANAIGGIISVIIRYLKDMHWAALAISTRIFGVIEMFAVCAALGLFCIPECGFERWSILVLAVIGCGVQACFIAALKIEEAHIVGLVDNATSIVMAVIFQIVFFADHPNTLKIIGAALVISSMLIVGGQKLCKKKN